MTNVNKLLIATIVAMAILNNVAKGCLPDPLPSKGTINNQFGPDNSLDNVPDSAWKWAQCCFSAYTNEKYPHPKYLCEREMPTNKQADVELVELKGSMCKYFAHIGKAVTYLANHRSLDASLSNHQVSDSCQVDSISNIFFPFRTIGTGDGADTLLKSGKSSSTKEQLSDMLKDLELFKATVKERNYGDILSNQDLLRFLFSVDALQRLQVVDVTYNFYIDHNTQQANSNSGTVDTSQLWNWPEFIHNATKQLAEIDDVTKRILGDDAAINSLSSNNGWFYPTQMRPLRRHSHLVVSLDDSACLALGLKDLVRSLTKLYFSFDQRLNAVNN